jgi:hypothetical protein
MVTGFEGAETGRAAVGWASDPILDEFSSLTPNHALLGTLARQTGGALVSLNALEDFARTAPNRSAPILETRLAPLWHKPTVFLFALFCFIAEWGLRRWRGMP